MYLRIVKKLAESLEEYLLSTETEKNNIIIFVREIHGSFQLILLFHSFFLQWKGMECKF